jgi:hypothetical protein
MARARIAMPQARGSAACARIALLQARGSAACARIALLQARGSAGWARFASAAVVALSCTPASAAAAESTEAPIATSSREQPGALGGLSPASATGAASASRFWATVNICDTERSPDALGVRASMPGNGRRERMYMRFRAQHWSGAEQRWRPVAGAGVSPWVYAGSARYANRQAGWTFAFAPPPAGVTFTMRAVVDFERRRGRARVMSRRRATTTGIAGVHGGDPPGTSKALCLIY